MCTYNEQKNFCFVLSTLRKSIELFLKNNQIYKILYYDSTLKVHKMLCFLLGGRFGSVYIFPHFPSVVIVQIQYPRALYELPFLGSIKPHLACPQPDRLILGGFRRVRREFISDSLLASTTEFMNSVCRSTLKCLFRGILLVVKPTQA